MKTIIKSLTTGFLAAMACLALCSTTRADLTLTTNSTVSSWLAVGGNAPFYATDLTGLSAQGYSQSAGSGPYLVLSETFTITNGAGVSTGGGVKLSSAAGNSNYVLTAIGAIVSGGSGPVQVHLFDVTTNLTSNNGTTLNGSGATYNFTANGDLLGGGNGLTFTNVNAGEKQITLSLQNGPGTQDQIVLGTNRTYALEFWVPVASPGYNNWYRNSVADAGGEAMGSHDGNLSVARLTIATLGLAGGAPRTHTTALYGTPTLAARTVNTNLIASTNYIVDQFNAYGYGPVNPYVGANNYSIGQITNVWTNWFGSAFSSAVWDSTSDANGNTPNSGSMKITAVFPGQFVVYDGFNGITPPLSCYSNGITSFQCDIRFDPSSPVTVNSGTSVTNYGHLQIGTRNGNSQDFWTAIEVPKGSNSWIHVNIPLSLSTDPNLFTINDVLFKIDGGWYGSTALSGTTTLWVDNVKFVGPATFTLPPAPTLSMQAAIPGLRLFAGSSANTYDRVELATIDNQQSWIGGSFPKTYSFKLLDYPANIGQTHIFLVPQNTSGQANMGNVNGSVNEYIEYQATNALWLELQPYGGGQVTASVLWKTNLANANPDHTLLLLTNSAAGTWTLKFTSASAGMVIAPDSSSASFTIADPNVATDFANPLVAYFGLQPNSGNGIGQFEDWASIQVTGVAGTKENDNFTTDTSLDNTVWNINTLTVALNSCVQLVTTNTPYWVSWTMPAVNYDLGTATNLNASITDNSPHGWSLPWYYNGYYNPTEGIQGSKTWVLLPANCLPTVDGSQGGTPAPVGFFRLFNPPLAN